MNIYQTSFPDPVTCQKARLSRDARFDGRFFTAVLSTGIYCRPICPARAPLEENVRYYPNAASAEMAGFRPCLRCRPELAPNEIGVFENPVIRYLLRWIQDGGYSTESIAELAASLDISERHLRRLCVQALGASPVQLVNTQRLLFAKQLLTDTHLSISHIALAAGFNSQRRFNAAFLDAYKKAPSRLRKSLGFEESALEGLVLKLDYRPPYDFSSLLSFFRKRFIAGLEYVSETEYCRLIGEEVPDAWFCISHWPQQNALKLELFLGTNTASFSYIQSWVWRIRRMFDLDADPQNIHACLTQIEWLSPLVEAAPGLRLPQAWGGWEAAVRAIVGQQITIKAASTIVTRIVQRLGKTASCEPPIPSLSNHFPSPEIVYEGDLSQLGLTNAKIKVLKAVALALINKEVGFEGNQSLSEFVSRWQKIHGIGPWTASYLAMRGWGYPDVLLWQDLIVKRALQQLGGDYSLSDICHQLKVTSPWRSYVVIYLWRWMDFALEKPVTAEIDGLPING